MSTHTSVSVTPFCLGSVAQLPHEDKPQLARHSLAAEVAAQPLLLLPLGVHPTRPCAPPVRTLCDVQTDSRQMFVATLDLPTPFEMSSGKS